MRCNASNPCTNIVFDNVQHNGIFSDFKNGFITENAYGTVINSYPNPNLGTNSTTAQIEAVSEIY